MNQMPVVELEGVTKRFGPFTAVHDVFLSVGNEYLCILGPSGCGKTLVLRLLAGFERLTAGKIRIRGQDVVGKKPYERNISMVFQDFALFPHLPVWENVAFGPRMQGIDKEKRARMAMETLKLVDLREFADRNVNQLSGGQRQRVGLARAIITEPAVLLLDEPTGSLDAALRGRMRDELRAMQGRLGIPFIHVTNSQDEALNVADRIVIMNEGRVEQVGTPQEIFEQPSSRFVARFMGKYNIFDCMVVSRDEERVVLEHPAGRFTVHTQRDVPDAGRPCSFCIRTDLVHADRAAAGGGRLKCRVSYIEYAGSVITYILRVADGFEVRLEQHEDYTQQERHQIGEELEIGWSQDDAVLLPT